MIFIANWKMHGNLKDISKVNLVLKFINQKKFKKKQSHLLSSIYSFEYF